MKSWLHTSDDPCGLKLGEIQIPEPGPDELLVRVCAAALNRGEFLARANAAGPLPDKPAGIECAGRIVKLGKGVAGFSVDDRVMGRAGLAFSEYALLRKGDTLRVPQGYSWEQAAGASITYQVSYEMLWWGAGLQTGNWLLITAVTSGVGVASLQLGKLLGAKVAGTSRSADKLQPLKEIGLDLGVTESDQAFVERIMAATDQQGIDLVVNNVGGSVFASCQKVLARQGRMATVGHVDGQGRAEIDLLAQHAKRQQFFGVSNKFRSAEEVTETVAAFSRDILPAMNDGRLRPLIDRVYEFTDAVEALKRMETNRHIGKIILKGTASA